MTQLKLTYSSITLVDPFYGGSSYTTKFEFESLKPQCCFSNSPDVVPIVFIFLEKSSETSTKFVHSRVS